MTYTVTFHRVGRNHHVAPLAVDADGPDPAFELAEKIYRYVRPHVMSRGVDVTVDLDTGTGQIFCGMNNGGTFTIQPTKEN